jgi:CubicO group peptidase (beta-lactamase class C family)
MLKGSESLGFSLVGYALAQLNHTTYRAMTDEKILKPLSMTMSSTAFTETMRPSRSWSPLHRRGGEELGPLGRAGGRRRDPFHGQ